MEQLFNEVNTFVKSHKALEKENNYLKLYIESVLIFFKHILKIGNESLKEAATKEIKNIMIIMIFIQMVYIIYQKEQ